MNDYGNVINKCYRKLCLRPMCGERFITGCVYIGSYK